MGGRQLELLWMGEWLPEMKIQSQHHIRKLSPLYLFQWEQDARYGHAGRLVGRIFLKLPSVSPLSRPQLF